MSDTHETLDAIIAEMRAARNTASDTTLVSSDWLDDWANRIKAAVARERNAHTNDIHNALYKATGIPGNAAAMRDALMKTKLYFDHRGEGTNLDDAGMAIDAITSIDTALATPARNCDVSCDTKATIERCLSSLNVESSSASFDAGVCAAIGWMLAAPAEGVKE